MNNRRVRAINHAWIGAGFPGRVPRAIRRLMGRANRGRSALQIVVPSTAQISSEMARVGKARTVSKRSGRAPAPHLWQRVIQVARGRFVRR